MRGYRLYFVGPDGHFANVVAFTAADDETAIAAVEAHVDGRGSCGTGAAGS